MAYYVWTQQGATGDLQSVAQKGLGKVARLYHANGLDLYITSLRDGTIHCPGSFHYIGLAFDFRKASRVSRGMLVSTLGDDWDVIEHSTHYHVEYDPK